MNIDRLKALTIKRLEHCFNPPGLPLVSKRHDSRPTTSILIRGDAGTGKTLLAVALAHDLAKHAGGSAFYLTTETFVVDVEAKIEMLGLKSVRNLAWKDRSTAREGDIIVEHLNERLETPVADAAEKRTRSLEIAHQYVDEANGTNIGAVVIDSLGLLVGTEKKESLRESILDFTQVLEANGISVVLVEEGTGTLSEIAGFACDVIFEPQVVALGAGPSRRLAIPKSRYAPVKPGLPTFTSPPSVLVIPSRLGPALSSAAQSVLAGGTLPGQVLVNLNIRPNDSPLPYHYRATRKCGEDTFRQVMSSAFPTGWVEIDPQFIGIAVLHPSRAAFAAVSPAIGIWHLSWAIAELDASSRPTAVVVRNVAKGEKLYGEDFEPFIWSLREFGPVIGLD